MMHGFEQDSGIIYLFICVFIYFCIYFPQCIRKEWQTMGMKQSEIICKRDIYSLAFIICPLL